MGVIFAKNFKFGAIRFNFSGSGIWVSAGGRGPSHRDWTRIMLRFWLGSGPIDRRRALDPCLARSADTQCGRALYPVTATSAAKTRVLLDFLIGWFKPFGSRGTETLPNS